MAAPPPLRLTASPPEELIEEILLRLPPDEPSSLLRASLICKPWKRMILHCRFRHRLHGLHGGPPVLGFLRNNGMAIQDFVATKSSAFSLDVPGNWRALDCRHGRALLLDMAQGSAQLVIWDPITGDQERVPVEAPMWDDTLQGGLPTAAIVCGATGCDHRSGCHGRRPFDMVIVYTDTIEDGENLQCTTFACKYSSEDGEWGEVSLIQGSALDFTTHTTSVLVRNSLLYFLSDEGTIVQYNLAGGGNGTTIPPTLELEGSDSVALVLTQDGRLGAVQSVPNSRLNIWSRVDMLWVNSRVICLDNLLPAAALGEVWPMSFAERSNALLIRTPDGIFTINLQSKRARKVCEDDDKSDSFVPIESFYIPQVE